MNTNISNPLSPLNINRRIFTVMLGIGFLCALVIASIFAYTQPIIEQNKKEALEQAIFSILPDATYKISYGLNGQGHFEQRTVASSVGQVVHAAYDKDQQLIGIVIAAQGTGYQDTIELLYGYQPDQQKIVGLAILASRETPGLGSKIAIDTNFLANFKQLDVTVSADKSSLLHDINVVRPGKKEHAWQIDSITGATIR
jgi:electron transport complex protein RnfG